MGLKVEEKDGWIHRGRETERHSDRRWCIGEGKKEVGEQVEGN